jgi:hypothetical protein
VAHLYALELIVASVAGLGVWGLGGGREAVGLECVCGGGWLVVGGKGGGGGWTPKQVVASRLRSHSFAGRLHCAHKGNM